MVSRWQLIKLYHQIAQGTYQKALWSTILFCYVSAILPSNKLFFVIATLYMLSLVYITQSIYKAFFLAFVPFLMLNIGQIYITTVIPFNELKHAINYEGRQFYFSFSPFFVLQITSIFLLITEIVRRRGKLKLNLSHIAIFGSILFSLISVFFTEQFPVYSLSAVIGILGSISWIVIIQLLFRDSKQNEQIKLLKSFLLVIVFMSSFQIAIGLGQYVRRATLNLRIEQSTVIPNFGQGADEDGTQFRPIGLQTHPNDFANSLLIFLFTALLLFEYLRLRKVHFPWWFELLFVAETVLMISITQSRAAYAGLGLASVLFFLSQRKVSLQSLVFFRKQLQPFIFVFITIAIIFVPMVFQRLLYSVNSFGVGGGFTTRQELEKSAIDLIQKHFLLGVGPRMFIPSAFKENPQGIIQYFPEDVHNGFLLFLTENGIISFTLLMLFFFFLLKDAEKYLSSTLRSIFYAGLVALSCMMLLHPVQHFLTPLTMITWLVVYIQQGNSYAKL